MNYKILSKRQLRRKIASSTKRTLDNLFSNAESFENLSNTGREQFNFITAGNSSTVVSDSEQNSVEYNNLRESECFFFNSLPFVHDTFFKEKSQNVDTNKINENEIDTKMDEQNFLIQLKEWAINNNITHTALNALLCLLKERCPFLPKDARTILGTPRNIERITLDNGELVYLGLEKQLIRRIDEGLVESKESIIYLQINIDGIPIFENSNLSFWPILARSNNLRNNRPFPVAIFCGSEKPQPLDVYLHKFIEEIKVFKNNGIHYNQKIYQVKILLFTCDAPARSYLKQIVGHTSKVGCERCNIKAINEEKKTYYPAELNCNPRLDEHFFGDTTANNHIKAKSPLINLSVGLVSQFVLDPMHLIYLGVVKRLLLHYWVDGKRPHKFSNILINRINTKIQSLKKYTLTDFNRKLRPLNFIKKWKAVEYRFFLLYCGPFILKNILNEEKYEHFILLHSAIFIFSSRYFIEKYFHVAKEFLQKFIVSSYHLYDKFFVTYNVHSLIHVCSDVERYGPLENFSCFLFESYLGLLKRKIRGKYLPLQQIYNRLQEIENTQVNEMKNNSTFPKFRHVGNNDSNYLQYEKLEMENFTISVHSPDNIVSVQKKICLIQYIFYKDEKYQCVGKVFKYLTDFYSKPFHSSYLGIFFARSESDQIIFDVSEITHKCIGFPYKDGFYVAPLIHHK